MTAGASDCGRRRFLLALVIYFALHVIVRLCLPDNVELDEAEQVLLTQKIAWGYGSQPPLYTWLQALFFTFFGQGVLALALLKNLLLFSLYLFTFLATREMTGENGPAMAAAASLLFIPQIAWESQRDLTHSVLATAVAAASIYTFVLLCRRGRKADYLIFGFCAGLGIIGKYNFAVFLIALLLAALSIPRLRRTVLCKNLLLTLLVVGLVTGGHLVWALLNTGDTLRQAGTFHREALPSIWLDYLGGGSALARAAVSFAGPLVAIHLLLFLHGSTDNQIAEPLPYRDLIGRTLIFGMLFCLLLVLVFRVTNFKDRWMQPVLFSGTIYLALRLRPRLDNFRLRLLLALSATVAVVVLVLLPTRLLFSGGHKRPAQLNAPFEEMASHLRATGFSDGVIFAENRWLGGNLHLQFPKSVVIVPELPPPSLPALGGRLLIWDATAKPEIPEPLAELHERSGPPRSTSEPAYIEKPYRHDHRHLRLGIIRSEP